MSSFPPLRNIQLQQPPFYRERDSNNSLIPDGFFTIMVSLIVGVAAASLATTNNPREFGGTALIYCLITLLTERLLTIWWSHLREQLHQIATQDFRKQKVVSEQIQEDALTLYHRGLHLSAIGSVPYTLDQLIKLQTLLCRFLEEADRGSWDSDSPTRLSIKIGAPPLHSDGALVLPVDVFLLDGIHLYTGYPHGLWRQAIDSILRKDSTTTGPVAETDAKDEDAQEEVAASGSESDTLTVEVSTHETTLVPEKPAEQETTASKPRAEKPTKKKATRKKSTVSAPKKPKSKKKAVQRKSTTSKPKKTKAKKSTRQKASASKS